MSSNDSRSADALHNRALAALSAGRFDEAISLFSQAISQQPNIARYFVNRGQAFSKSEQAERAIQDFRRAIAIQPANAIAHFNLAVSLRTIGQLDDAIESYRQAIRIKPDYAKAHYNLANALRAGGAIGEAEGEFRDALAADPNYAEAWNNFSEVLEERREVDEAMRAVSRAIELRPNHSGAHFNRGFLHLLRGEYESGWREYEWRFAAQNIAPFSTTIPKWTGLPLAGKSLLLVGEQGAGDTIQFVRYASLLAQRGAKIIVAVNPNLASLMCSVPGVSDVIDDDEQIPPVDFYLPMLSAPTIFNTTLATIPRDLPYITPDAAKVEHWQNAMASRKKKLNIGISWAGNPRQANDRNRSAPLAALESLAGLADAAIFSLQKGPSSSQIATCGFDVADLSNEIENFSDTAAIISNLDVVVSVCTSVAHVAGAMGKRTLTMLCFNADWRWLLDRQDSPWYPSMKLFRQKSPGDWGDVARRVREELTIR